MSMVESGVVTPLLAHHPRRIRMKNVDKDGNIALDVIIRGFIPLALHLQRAINTGSETESRERHQFQKNQEAGHRKRKQLVNTSEETRRKAVENLKPPEVHR